MYTVVYTYTSLEVDLASKIQKELKEPITNPLPIKP